MNNGIDIVALATELKRQSEVKNDFLVDSSGIELSPTTSVSDDGLEFSDGVELRLEGAGSFAVTDHAHKQIATNLKIPAAYYGRMLADQPDLLADNVNTWLKAKAGNKRMVRTLDGGARAFLSDRYRRIDNEQIAEAVLPVLLENAIDIKSTEITSRAMYIKALFPKVEGEVKVGDVVRSGIVISNSEIGAGSLSIQPFVYRLVCTNGMVGSSGVDFGFNRSHLGRRWDIGDAVELFRDETLLADDKALMMKVQDVVRSTMDPLVFSQILEKMQASANTEKLVSPTVTIERLADSFPLRENERNSILENLIRAQDYTQWGALNAVTELANTQKSYERSTELEVIGGKILDLNPTQWHQLAKAA